MKANLPIILVVSLLIFINQPVQAVVQHHIIENKVTTNKKFSVKRLATKLKKRGKSIQKYWENTISEKKKFGKIGSITLFVLLSTATFTVLKLTGVIAWSWFWVLSPLIFYFGLIILIGLIALFAVLALKSANE